METALVKQPTLKRIHQWLIDKGYEVVLTREPGGTPTGEQIREILLHTHGELSKEAELLLMFAARQQNIQEVILPSLELGKSVLCDRFTDASYAYQGGGRGVSMSRIAQLEQWVQGGLQPDLTILLDVPVKTGIARTARREQNGETSDRFESTSNEFKAAVRQVYLDRCRQFPERIKRVESTASIEQVGEAIELLLSVHFAD